MQTQRGQGPASAQREVEPPPHRIEDFRGRVNDAIEGVADRSPEESAHHRSTLVVGFKTELVHSGHQPVVHDAPACGVQRTGADHGAERTIADERGLGGVRWRAPVDRPPRLPMHQCLVRLAPRHPLVMRRHRRGGVTPVAELR